RRQDALIRKLRRGLLALAILPLARLLLHAFVRHEKARGAVPDDEADPIRVGRVVLEVRGEMRRRSVVRRVLLDRRIEIAIRSGGAGGHADRRPRPAVLGRRVAASRREAAERGAGAAVKTAPRLPG